MQRKNPHSEGFTLLELSIVLVIIGLVVGGVLVGRSLFKTSEFRGTLSQIEKYTTATNVFKMKYEGLPGDLSNYTAASFGLSQIDEPSYWGFALNNGIIEGGTYGEGLAYWRHLSEAKLIQESLGTNPSNPLQGNGSVSVTTYDATQFVPAAKMAGLHFQMWDRPTALGTDKANSFWISRTRYFFQGLGAQSDFAMSGIDAYALDNKLDDGAPNTGRVRMAFGKWINNYPTGYCIYGGNTSLDPQTLYNHDISTGGDQIACAVSIVMK